MSFSEPKWDDLGDFDRGFTDPFDSIPRIHLGEINAERTLCGIGTMTSPDKSEVTCKRCQTLMTKGVMGVCADDQ